MPGHASSRTVDAFVQTNIDVCIDAAVAQYRLAVTEPPRINFDLTGNRETVHRAVLAIALSDSPTYLGSVHLLPVVDAFCALCEVEHVAELDPQAEITSEAMHMSMIGVDLKASEAGRIIARVTQHLAAVGDDFTRILTHGSGAQIREVVEGLFGGNPCQGQYLLECANIGNVRAVPTGGATVVAARIGLCHFSEGLFGFEHMRQVTCGALQTYPTTAWHALQFLSDVVCESHLGCCGCAASQTCVALCEGWI